MRARFQVIPGYFAAALLAASTGCLAEAALRTVTPLMVTSAMLQEAATPVLPAKSAPYLRRELAQPPERIHLPITPVGIMPNDCARNSGALCYDYRSGRAVYKPMRSFLPAIPGMTAHNLSIHRDKVVAQYTFK
jgi:hypothetical protein